MIGAESVFEYFLSLVMTEILSMIKDVNQTALVKLMVGTVWEEILLALILAILNAEMGSESRELKLVTMDLLIVPDVMLTVVVS